MRTNHVPKDVSEQWFGTLSSKVQKATDFSLCDTQQLFQIRFLKREKRGVLNRDSRSKYLMSKTWWTQSSSFRTWFVRDTTFDEYARWSHAWRQSARTAVGTKYYLAVRRSCSWLGRRLQCMWTHVVHNHDPNHVLDRDPKRDSFSCEHSHIIYSILQIFDPLIWGEHMNHRKVLQF